MRKRFDQDHELQAAWGGIPTQSMQDTLDQVEHSEPPGQMRARLIALKHAEPQRSVFQYPVWIGRALALACIVLVIVVVRRGAESPAQQRLMAQREIEEFIVEFASLDQEYEQEELMDDFSTEVL